VLGVLKKRPGDCPSSRPPTGKAPFFFACLKSLVATPYESKELPATAFISRLAPILTSLSAKYLRSGRFACELLEHRFALVSPGQSNHGDPSLEKECLCWHCTRVYASTKSAELPIRRQSKLPLGFFSWSLFAPVKQRSTSALAGELPDFGAQKNVTKNSTCSLEGLCSRSRVWGREKVIA
jgi:hypothetical protein